MRISKHTNYTLLVMLFLFSIHTAHSQRVGLVLSGGAASGIAHIGVIKALEENHIPIDYITGTSMGAFVGSMYAMGYSPEEMENFVKSERFRNMSDGDIEQKYAYYFKRGDNNSSWLTLRLFDSTILSAIPTNVISPIAMDFGMLELTGGPAAAAGYKFDSLFVPFRCVSSDIEKKESVVFKDGDLSQAVRSSMSYPFYIRPILVNGKLLFDGGLYNNFPTNIMYQDFFPDYIIGSKVSANNPPPDEDNVLSQIKSMLQSKSNFDLPCDNGVIIQPKTNVGLFNFSDVQPLIDSGYVATMRQIQNIKRDIERKTNAADLKTKRAGFKSKQPKVIFDKIIIEGLNDTEADYARKILLHKDKQVDFEALKAGYFRLSADSKIKYIYPTSKYNPQTGFYDLFLRIKKEKHLILDFGGVFSSRPISEGFLSLKYNELGKFATEITANGYFGKLYNSAQLKARFDFPLRTPIYIEPNITWNKFDYYKSSSAFMRDVRPEYLLQNEEYGNINLGFPTGKKGRIVTGVGGGQITDKYYQTSVFTARDTADRNDFDFYTAQAYYEINTLNRKQYANQGEYLNIKVRYVTGMEKNTPGSTSADSIGDFHKQHEYYFIKMKGERYFNRRGTFKIGLYGEVTYSTQTLFRNYTSTILSAPAFQPTLDSRTIFLENYRANEFVAGGVKFVVNIRKNIELRAEAYLFQPYEAYQRTSDNRTTYTLPFYLQHYIGSGAIVWNTPIGPMSLSVNYYDQVVSPFSVDFHFGYILFNKRALE